MNLRQTYKSFDLICDGPLGHYLKPWSGETYTKLIEAGLMPLGLPGFA
jgi:hypothetical protein